MQASNAKQQTLAVLGAGAWGTALAVHLARKGHRVHLWDHQAARAERLAQARENQRYLPGVMFPDSLTAHGDLSEVLPQAEGVLVVVPSHAFRAVLKTLSTQLAPSVPVAWATKGFEPETCLLLHQVAADELGDTTPQTVVSGPTFASEVAKGLPTAMVAASSDLEMAKFWADAFHNEQFRMYTQQDMAGVEIGGAYKNIMAIATGLSDGLSLGANARAALISRGMVEMMRLANALGGHQETMMGLSGLGDLVLTCTDDQSRNRRYGMALAQSQAAGSEDAAARSQRILQSIGQVVEGIKAAEAVKHIAQRHQLELPIMAEVWSVIHNRKSVEAAAQALMARSGKSELEFF
ncbi:glycerol-3-phosphate dehydrogenase [Thiomicrospira sp. WB1]|nr:NAD(P)H-dependent glycerol-3-phosphate dehydrogenase [Thiomicrospira sp. WB1]KUJ71054.1 glycerol-3-phosphate dehydrogenase [Thiomicrospira sp. WB1]